MWCRIRCSFADETNNWQRDYKRQYGPHDHDVQGAFVRNAKGGAVGELRASGQAWCATVVLAEIVTTNLQVELPNDPGNNFRQI